PRNAAEQGLEEVGAAHPGNDSVVPSGGKEGASRSVPSAVSVTGRGLWATRAHADVRGRRRIGVTPNRAGEGVLASPRARVGQARLVAAFLVRVGRAGVRCVSCVSRQFSEWRSSARPLVVWRAR